MTLALYGKHPGRGDFLTRGIDPRLQAPLEAWTDLVLSEMRETLGPEWETVWDSGTTLGFWVGEAIWGLPIAGVMQSSRDKVGRRFPLMILAQGATPAPPTIGGDAWQQKVAARLTECLSAPDIDDPLTGLQVDDPDYPVDGPHFWAMRPGCDAGALWADMAANDHRRAAVRRSYWWLAGEEAVDISGADGTAEPARARLHPPRWSQVWSGEGLPSGAVLAWFFRGYRSND
jgi:type VI secretion system protein ImpM